MKENSKQNQNTSKSKWYIRRNGFQSKKIPNIVRIIKKNFSSMCFMKTRKKIYKFVHDANRHCGFHRAYTRASGTVYIRHMTKRLRRYIRHCKQCLKTQIMRHAFYGELIFIKTITFSFHIITIDFIVVLSMTKSEMNAIFITIDKFFKRINIIFEKTT